MNDNSKAALWGAFVADALSLSVHWVYNTRVIDKKIGRVDRYHDPLTSYHKGKQAGDLTHYGDQMLVLLEASSDGGFDAQRFAERWRDLFDAYTGYIDKASQTTLDNIAAGKGLLESGSDSDDLAGASRMAALIPRYADDPEALVRHARAQTAITHDHGPVVSSADFFARCTTAILGGQSPVAAMETVLAAHFADTRIGPSIRLGLESREGETRQVIADFGQMCSVEAGLPGAVHLIVRYADDYQTAMVENVMAGGDSAARGILAGMVLGAAHGLSAIPEDWIADLNAGDRIAQLLDQHAISG